MFEENKALNKYESWYQTKILGKDISYKKKSCRELIENNKSIVDPSGDLIKSDKVKFLQKLQKEMYPYLKEMFLANDKILATNIMGVINSRKVFEYLVEKESANRKDLRGVFIEGVMESPFLRYGEKRKIYYFI